MKKLIIASFLMVLSPLSLAQQELIEIARQDIRTGRMGIIASAMDLTPEQQEKFWPLYRQYADEQEQLLDKRIAMLQDFVGSYDTMSDEMANRIAEQSFAIQRERTDRRERYFRKMSEILGPMLAARFIQIDSQVSTLMDFELTRSTPLFQLPETE